MRPASSRGVVGEVNAPGTTLVVAILASFIAFLDGSIITVALPAISADLGGGVGTQQWVLDAYLLTLGSFILLAGSLADSFGHVRVLRIGLVVFGVGSVACALAPWGGVLIGSRVVQGLGAALLVPGSLALISAAFPGERRGAAIGTWTAWTSTAFIVAPLLGGVLVDSLGWRFIFAINVVPILVALALTRHAGRRGPATGSRIDIIGAALAACGLAGAVYALIEQQRLGWAHPAVFVSLTVGVACLVAFFWWERRAPAPMLPLALFRIRNFRNGNLATAAIYAGVALGPLVVVLYLQEVAGFSATLAGLATLPVAVISLVLSRVFGGLAGKHGPRFFMTCGPAVSATGFLLMLSTSADFTFAWQVLPGLVVYGIGLSITVTPLTTAVLGAVPLAEAGIGSAVNNAVARISGLIAIAFLGTITGAGLSTQGFHGAVVVTAACFVVGSLVSAVGIENQRVDPASIPTVARANCSDRPTTGAITT